MEQICLDEEGGAEFGMTSEDAWIACAEAPCLACRERIEVICIYCESGADAETGDPMMQFTVSNVCAMDSALAIQLERWSVFRRHTGVGSEEGYFANHCPHCGTLQEDYLLHSEPGDVFFSVSRADPGPMEFTPLVGRIQVSGDCSFGV